MDGCLMSSSLAIKDKLQNLFHGIFLRAFFSIMIAFVISMGCIVLFLRPETREDGFVAHFSAEFTQDLLNVSLNSKSMEEINNYLTHQKDDLLNRAQVISKYELITSEASRKFGIWLSESEKRKIFEGKAFVTENQVIYQQAQNDSFFLPPQNNLNETLPETPASHPHPSFIVLPISNSPYVIFARRSTPVSPEIPISSFIICTLLIIIILLATVLYLLQPVIRRIINIEETCIKVSNGDYDARCHDTKKDSIGILAKHVDDMTAAIGRHLGQQKSLLQAVSHELRTPLARIRFTVEMLNIPEDDEKSMERLDSIDDDLTEIDDLIKELSYFNYVDAGKGRQNFEFCDLTELIDMTVHQRSLAIKDFDFHTKGLDDDMALEADPTAFKRVIGNLLSNAARYAVKQIMLKISYDEDRKNIIISVEDDGPGIPEDKREAIFEPFVCLEKSRSKSMTGCGLGLAIADRIMKVHRGSISAQASELGGAKMITIWPVSQSNPH